MLPVLFLWACAVPEPPPHPNVLLVTLDTTRADRLGLYGYHRPTSPNLDALAERAVVFDDFVVPMATTLPTHVSVLTGTHPLEHGVLANIKHGGERFVTSPGLRTLAEYLSDVGYVTQAFVSATPLKRGTGVEAGFHHFSEPEGRERAADVTTREVVRHMRRRDRSRPQFVWVHYFDPHNPFTPPEPFASRFRADAAQQAWIAARAMAPAQRPSGERVDPVADGDLYDGEIAFVDEQLGLLLDAGRRDGWLTDAVVVVLGDHGEGLGQHGMAGHGSVWMEQLHAPWLLAAPGLAPRRVARTVTATDVVPTLLGLLDLPGEEAFLRQVSGVDALGDAPERPVFSHGSSRQVRLGAGRTRSVVDGDWQWLEVREGERLFFRRDDPHGLVDLAAARPEEAARLRAEADRLEAALSARGDALGRAPAARVDDTLVEELRALGYVE